MIQNSIQDVSNQQSRFTLPSLHLNKKLGFSKATKEPLLEVLLKTPSTMTVLLAYTMHGLQFQAHKEKPGVALLTQIKLIQLFINAKKYLKS